MKKQKVDGCGLNKCCQDNQQRNEVIKIGPKHAIDDSKNKNLTEKKNTHKLHRALLASRIRQKISEVRSYV